MTKPQLGRWEDNGLGGPLRAERTANRARAGLSVLLLGVGLWAPWVSSAAEAGRVVLTPREGAVRVEIDGRLFTEYLFADQTTPVLYPLLGPGEVPLSRGFPIVSDLPGESRDHPHHRSLWFGHGDVNRVDFWTLGPRAGRVVAEGLSVSGDVLASTNRWQAPGGEGRVLCRDTRRIRFAALPEGLFIDYALTLHAADEEVTLADTKEAGMAIRTIEALRLRAPGGRRITSSHAINSEGARDLELWGKRARWVAYWGLVGDATLGVAIFDHSGSLRHPTGWHARDYGLVAANPFAVHDFGAGPRGAGEVRIPKRESLKLRYGFLFFRGDPQSAGVSALYERWIAETNR